MTFRSAPEDAATTAARFTPAELADFYRLAAPNLRRGLWSGVRRRSGGTFDRLEILLPGVAHPVLSIERDCRGACRLWWHAGEQEKHRLHSGPALGCLTPVLRRLSRRAGEVPGSAAAG